MLTTANLSNVPHFNEVVQFNLGTFLFDPYLLPEHDISMQEVIDLAGSYIDAETYDFITFPAVQQVDAT